MPQHPNRGRTGELISKIRGLEAVPPGVLRRVLGEKTGGMAESMADFFTESMFSKEDPRMGQEFPGRPGPVDLLIAALGVKSIGSLAKKGYNSLVRPGLGAEPITDVFGMNRGPIGRREFFFRGSGAPRRASVDAVSRGPGSYQEGGVLDRLQSVLEKHSPGFHRPGEEKILTPEVLQSIDSDATGALSRTSIVRTLMKKRFGMDVMPPMTQRTEFPTEFKDVFQTIDDPLGRSWFGLGTDPNRSEYVNSVLRRASRAYDNTLDSFDDRDAMVKRVLGASETRGEGGVIQGLRDKLTAKSALDLLSGDPDLFGEAQDVFTGPKVRGELQEGFEYASGEAEKIAGEIKSIVDELFKRFGVRRGKR
jgi:hypothetical protein